MTPICSYKILGLDPGLRHTGWGVVNACGNARHFIACGTINPDNTLPLAARLASLHHALTAIITTHAPDEAAIEETFMNDNPRSALKLGAARGVAMLAPALAGLAVHEYAPNVIKKTIVGAGHADKTQIAMMVKILLPQAFHDNAKHSADALDALAIALTHAQHLSHHHRTSHKAAS